MKVHRASATSHGSHLHSRRDFMHVGGLSALGYLISEASPFKSNSIKAAEGEKKTERTLTVETPHEMRFLTPDGTDPEISVINIDLKGGLSQADTFDWKPNSPFKLIPTSASKNGVFVTEPLWPLANQMDEILIVNNMRHGYPNHDQASALMYTQFPDQVGTSFNDKPTHDSPQVEFARFLDHLGSKSIGYVVSHSCTPRLEIDEKGNIKPVEPYKWPFCGTHYNHDETIYIPINYETGELDLEIGGEKIDKETLQRRQELLEKLEEFGIHFAGLPIERWQKHKSKIDNILGGEFFEALDLKQEPLEVRERYGFNYFANQLLGARRLVEREVVRYVNVQVGDFDTHELAKKNLWVLLPPVAKAISALLWDIKRLGLKVAVPFLTEFGRKIEFNPYGGREHWSEGFSVAFAGYGIEGGRKIGKTNGKSEVLGEANDARNLQDTIFDLMKIGRFEVRNGQSTNNRFSFMKLS